MIAKLFEKHDIQKGMTIALQSMNPKVLEAVKYNGYTHRKRLIIVAVRNDIEKEAMNLLIEKDWSGNIRQLRNVIERLIILSEKIITEKDIKKYV